MKQVFNTTLRRTIVAMMAFIGMLLPAHMQANDYLEQQDHYFVYGAGSGVVHFKIPIYSRGGWDYLLSTDENGNSAFYYKIDGTEHEIFYVGGSKDSDGPSADDDYTYGRAYVTALTGIGQIEVTNIHDGTRALVPTDANSHSYDVTKVEEALNDKDYVTWLEIDWYMPQSLDGKDVLVGAHLKISRRASSSVKYTKDWEFDTFRGAEVMMDPQLLDPYFYTAKDAYVSGYGCAAVPYVEYYDPTKYYMYFGNRPKIDVYMHEPSYQTDSRTGNLYVPTTDTIQPGFRAMFYVYRRKSPDEMTFQVTNPVAIPAYHRIYDFAVTEERDKFDTYTGNNKLTWRLKNPQVTDLVEGDYFEVQRALKSDFSDAQTIDVVQMEIGEDKGGYVLVDNNRDMWTGHVNVENNVVEANVEHVAKDYALYATDGSLLCQTDIKISSDKLRQPSVPVYYRVRRASASMWGWKGHDFARDAVCQKHSFLAPLAATQPDYTLNSETRQVDFRIRIENAETDMVMPAPEDVQLEFSNTRTDRAQVVISGYDGARFMELFLRVYPHGDDPSGAYNLPYPSEDRSFYVDMGAIIEVRSYTDESHTDMDYFTRYSVFDARVNIEVDEDGGPTITSRMTGYPTNSLIDERFAAVKAHLLDSLRPLLRAEASKGLGRCVWDKSARLVLIKTLDGLKQEIIISPDSIRRQADGNWEAHFVDVADHACAEYSYAVRIDQSSSDLHVSDSAYLQPVAINGPNLYFEDGAHIKTAKASYSDARSDMKRGIMLEWTATTAAVDQYVILRGKYYEEPPHDTVYVGVDNTFFDTDVHSGVEYNYDIHAIYDCNGRHSDHYKRVTGRRSNYGEISGRILMPDNSGMAGVTVSMTKQGEYGTYTRITGADGTFKFDSLLYGGAYSGGADFTIVPTAKYGTFSFNNTSAASATVHLSEDNCIARDIDFVNTSTMRLSGRALYKGSTIPVSGALFLLNGDTIRRNGAPLKTGIDGNFELMLTQGQPYRLQIIKEGHTFEGDGILRIEQDKDTFALDKSLDGIRFYDETKVRLVGRVAGGNDQRDLPEAFGLGKNNLGDDLQLVLQLEGDNTSHIVHDPNDPTLDSIQQTFAHLVYSTDPYTTEPERTVGNTSMLMQKKRIIIRPDAATGEYEVDLFPVKYKVVQVSAKGYATLLAAGQGNEVFDLTNAPLVNYSPKRGTDSVHYNAVYDRIYHTPVQIHMRQLLFGLPQAGYGEKSMKVSSFNQRGDEEVALYIESSADNIEGADFVTYTMGYPVFYNNRKYQFEAQAYEDYYFNNSPEDGSLDRVPQRGGSVTIHNGMEGPTKHFTYPLDSVGKNRNIYLNIDRLETELEGTSALHAVSAALEVENNTVETEVFRAFIAGDLVQENELQSTDADITILDIVRDPGGNGSSAWVETGTTYDYSYNFNWNVEAGVQLSPTWGVNVTSSVGFVSVNGAVPPTTGQYTGTSISTKKEFLVDIPFSRKFAGSTTNKYSFTTNNKISTSSAKNSQSIGANADVFLGATTSVLTGKAKSVSVINDTMYHQHLPAIQAGTMRVLAQGVDTAGKPYYLVVAEKVVLGSRISNTFVYTQYHILNTVLPRILRERNNLLEFFADQTAAQAAANQRNEPVYWYIDSTMAVQLNDTLLKDTYKMIKPAGDAVYVDKVEALDNAFIKWISVLYNNEKEKLSARYTGTQIGIYSVSAGSSYTHTDGYSGTISYSELPQTMSHNASGGAQTGAQLITKLVGETLGSLLQQAPTTINSLLSKITTAATKTIDNAITNLGSESGSNTFRLQIAPIIEVNLDSRTSIEQTNKKSAGFTIVPDNQGEITVAVYRANVDSVWNATANKYINELPANYVDSEKKYGSYVFFTQAGSTYCMYEDEDSTRFYNPGTPLNHSTMLLAKPDMSINTYEQTNVLPDQRAKFKLVLHNAGEVPYGWAGNGTFFTLSLTNNSNPNGAKLYVNGAPLAQGLEYYMLPGESVVQTVEVERGDVDDYENLQLCFNVSDCPKNWTFLDFSVHYIPLSCGVQIDMPRQNWVMNTLSQHDSAGYYLPIEISGFDIHHKNFDHIEFQYKRSSESEEMWVNQCSFYAEDSLYEKATGNKAMIENGRIAPFRFYGDRDPMEQQYDLRAVSFCRYGSGFVTKASPVISGMKDTRVPRVFGSPQPADAILGVGNDFKLRFNEAIAGNYLDEDNNFQVIGMTNATGITTGTNLHFNGAEGSDAITKVNRSLTNSSFSIDMIIRPADAQGGSLFFTSMTNSDYAVQFAYRDGRLALLLTNEVDVYTFWTETNVLPTGVFSRVAAVYDNEKKDVRFYIGTQAIPLASDCKERLPVDFTLTGSAPLRFGGSAEVDMLEARVWLKALTMEDLAATNMKYLTGYERDLLAYYRMNEGHGETVQDRANGATLYLNGTSWNLKKGISLAVKANERAVLNGNLLSRSASQDESILLWFKTAKPNGTIFSIGRTENDTLTLGTKIALENGVLMLHNDSAAWAIGTGLANNEWHHLVLAVDRTSNNVSVFVDSEMTQSFSATALSALSGAMYLGGGGFEGNIDDLVFFEQALPKYLIQEFDNCSPTGDEMGIFGYLPFEQQILNQNGVLELVFSPNDRRIFRDPEGNVIDKVIPLITGVEGAASAEALADKINHAPTRDQGLLTKMNFDWAFNNDELLINLNMADREINKQTIYVTVRDVEDLNGNPMASPVTWVAFVDRNALKWSERNLTVSSEYGQHTAVEYPLAIINESGRRHQYRIESLPDWLTIDKTYGSLNAEEETRLTLTFNPEMPVGVYNDQVYLIDEDGLAEPLIIEYTVAAQPPYDEIDHNKYQFNMSVCGQVKVVKGGEQIFDTDPNDIVYAVYRNECIGMAHVAFNTQTNRSELFLTVYGSDAMDDKPIRFQLWRAANGKTYNLLPDREIKFAHGAVYGCGGDEPVVMTAGGSEMQTISLKKGWNWVSTYLQVPSSLQATISAEQPWIEGDLIKNSATRQYSTYSEQMDLFVGELDKIHFSQMYMVYVNKANDLQILGNELSQDSMQITLRGDGQWNELPCLYEQVISLREAMGDYYSYASPGDLIKSHHHFATYSADGRWVGDLTSLTPGEGYFFRRMGAGSVTVHFYKYRYSAPWKKEKYENEPMPTFSNPKASTNMTMIAKIEGLVDERVSGLEVYIDDDLVGKAKPFINPSLSSGAASPLSEASPLYFLTIQSDAIGGTLRFEMDGQELTIVNEEQLDNQSSIVNRQIVNYVPDSHWGSLQAPVILTPIPSEEGRGEALPYKIIEDDHVVIIKNNEKYDVTGKKL